MVSHLHNLSLRELSIEDLRTLASDHTELTVDQIDKSNKTFLISILAEAASIDGDLARKLRKNDLAIKPSFYLMAIGDTPVSLRTPRTMKKKLQESIADLNSELTRENSRPNVRQFSLEYVDHGPSQCVEIHVTWEKSYVFWSPEVKLESVYELRFGFVILDLKGGKALVACHTENERDSISKCIRNAYGIKLTPLSFTKELLDQIGTFDKVKRASYFLDSKDRTVPENVTYADDQLGSIPIAFQEENNPRSTRQQSFYRIAIGASPVEQGVGATSKSGKLWLPRETPISSVREFGIGLLAKISKTISLLGKRGEVEQIATVMNLSRTTEIEAISPQHLRTSVCDLVIQLSNMLLKKETERPFTPPISFATTAVPKCFQYPTLLLSDDATGETSRWSDKDNQPFVKCERDGPELRIQEWGGSQIDTTSLRHPVTDEIVSLNSPINNLELLPAPKLHAAVLEGIKLISQSLTGLSGVTSVPFRISQGKLLLDVKRAFGETPLSQLPTEVSPREVHNLRTAFKNSNPSREDTLRVLLKLGEKCTHMTDENCQACLSDQRFLCLRSFVARFFEDPLILAHKGIELSDGQFNARIGGSLVKLFSFAKMATSAKSNLTARNKNGAILLAQVVGQVDKTAFQVVTVISPSTVNEDLRERLNLVCSLFNKRLLILDYQTLALMWQEFVTNIAAFEGIDVVQMIEDSNRKTVAKRRKVVS